MRGRPRRTSGVCGNSERERQINPFVSTVPGPFGTGVFVAVLAWSDPCLLSLCGICDGLVQNGSYLGLHRGDGQRG